VKKKVTLIVLALGLLMMFAAVAPVFAYDPKPHFSFTQGQWAVANPSVPGTITIKNNVETIIGSESTDYRYSSMFGYLVFNEILNNQINMATLTGFGFGTAKSASAIGSTRVELYAWTLNGLGPYTYEGPTFKVGVGPTSYYTGEPFYGVLTKGCGTFMFTSGPYAGETGVLTFAGCYPTAGWGISSWTYYVG